MKTSENITKAKKTLALTGRLSVRFKWGVSRGYNTYGYRICTLVGNDNVKLSSCNGGGYDMRGTVLADFINVALKDELIAFNKTLNRNYNDRGYRNFSDGENVEYMDCMLTEMNQKNAQ